jgi:flagellar biosynthesis chaperone FliJ
MKRRQFRLATVLRHYELRKQEADYELQQGMRLLAEIDAEIARLEAEISRAAQWADESRAAVLSMSGWIACYRRADHLSKLAVAGRDRRQAHLAAIAKLEATRTRWAVAEESLVSLRQTIAAANHAEEAKAQQLIVDETVLRRWLGFDAELSFES